METNTKIEEGKSETIEYRTLKGLPKKYNNWYIVSSKGEIFSTCYNKITRMRGSMSKGYRSITFVQRNRDRTFKCAYSTLIHRLVAETFLGKCPKGMEVHHIDNNKLNNDISNLKYVSRESNMIRAWCEGRFSKVSAAVKAKRKELDGKCTSLTTDDVRQIRRLRRVLTNAQVGYVYSLHPMQISRIVNKRSFANVE